MRPSHLSYCLAGLAGESCQQCKPLTLTFAVHRLPASRNDIDNVQTASANQIRLTAQPISLLRRAGLEPRRRARLVGRQ
jgi:hypothetical protein